MVSLPAAWAERTYGADISAADVSAVAVTNWRRDSFFRDMAFPSQGEPMTEQKSLLLLLLSPPGPARDRAPGACGDFFVTIRAELFRRVEKSDAAMVRTYVADCFV